MGGPSFHVPGGHFGISGHAISGGLLQPGDRILFEFKPPLISVPGAMRLCNTIHVVKQGAMNISPTCQELPRHLNHCTTEFARELQRCLPLILS